jgi:hypothetical protein
LYLIPHLKCQVAGPLSDGQTFPLDKLSPCRLSNWTMTIKQHPQFLPLANSDLKKKVEPRNCGASELLLQSRGNSQISVVEENGK